MHLVSSVAAVGPAGPNVPSEDEPTKAFAEWVSKPVNDSAYLTVRWNSPRRVDPVNKDSTNGYLGDGAAVTTKEKLTFEQDKEAATADLPQQKKI